MIYMEKKPTAISILSGGLDSTVATAYLTEKYEIHAITFDYGQRSADKEIEAAQAITNSMNMEHTIIKLPWLKKLGGSALTTDNEVPSLKIDQLDDMDVCGDTAHKVWVPGRNIVFTAIATSFAEALGANVIITGWDHEEAVTFPDNSKDFLEAFNQVLKIGSIQDIQIEAPLINFDKKEIVELGLRINAPLELSYSCYMGQEEPCGVCESCLRRQRAFLNTGLGKEDLEHEIK
jgi:7-cyano-7-deazaguanine synthase